MNKGLANNLFGGLVYLVLILFALIIFIPLLYLIFTSFATEQEILSRGFFIFPKQWTFGSYQFLFHYEPFMLAYKAAIEITVVGVLVNLAMTTLMAYGLSKSWLVGRKVLNFMIVFTMLFNGGMIPTYLVVYELGLLNNYWALWLVSAISAFNLIVMRSFFRGIPEEISEQARIDGCGEWRLLGQIVLPLSKPALATFTLLYLVFQWNTYFNAILYLNDATMYPLQVFLRTILVQDESMIVGNDITSQFSSSPATKNAAIFLTALPLLAIYPFLQKYFVKGMLLGSVKG